MRKAKIYKPTKTTMQSGMGKSKNWILSYDQLDSNIDPLMGWETSKDTLSQIVLEFSTKELAVNYAKKNKIDYYVIEPKKRKLIIKPYADNFTKDS